MAAAARLPVLSRIAKGIAEVVSRLRTPTGLSAVSSRGVGAGSGGWYTLFSGRPADWFQRDIDINPAEVSASWCVFACKNRIASDMGKLRLRLVELSDGIWRETASSSFSPVLRKPNHYQTRQQFIEAWMLSKLGAGNAYILKERDARGVVVKMHVLDPQRVVPLVAPDGSVYYQLQDDDLAQVPVGIVAAPASEIIHDRMMCLFHPLVGVSPVYAAGLAAMQGLRIQKNSALFFENMSRPSGILTAPHEIADDTAKRLKDHWETNYNAGNLGKVAVLGDGLKYEPMSTNAEDSQLVEQLKLSAEIVCSVHQVPPFKIGIGSIPAGQKVEDMNTIYYADCLQAHAEAIEALLDDGLGLTVPKEAGRVLGVEFDLDDLLKMDSKTATETLDLSVKGGWMAPNEARRKRNLPPAEGGQTPYMQQQNYALAALAKRDSSDDPFATAAPPAPSAPDPEDDADEEAADEAIKSLAAHLIGKIKAVTDAYEHR